IWCLEFRRVLFRSGAGASRPGPMHPQKEVGGVDQIITAAVAVIGVPLVLLGYIILGERVIERLPDRVQTWIRPYFWALPAIGFATIFMVYPLIRTVFLSFRNNADTDCRVFNN